MNEFFPFIYKKEEKFEPLPLQIELIPTLPLEKEEETEEPGVIIIENF